MPTIGQLSSQIKNGKIAGRLCAVCGKRNGEHTYGFRETLRANGIEGDKAHVKCVQSLSNAKMKRDRV